MSAENVTDVLITGGNGFIGRFTQAALRERGLSVIATDLPGPPPSEHDRPIDITDFAAVRSLFAEVRPATVIHLAALLGTDSNERPRDGMNVNVNGMQNVLDAS